MSRIALVTGGTRGIGAEISRELKAAGRVVIAPARLPVLASREDDP